MKVKTIYVADDGTEFDNEEDCKKYENRVSFTFQKEYAVGTEIILRVVKYTACEDCVFGDVGDFDNCAGVNCHKYLDDRKDNKDVMYKLVEVKEPCRTTGKNEQEDQE